MAWELIFMLLILKIPLVYLCLVVWWAVKAEPTAEEPPADEVGVREPLVPGPRWAPRALRGGPIRRVPPSRPVRRPTGARPTAAYAELHPEPDRR
jgi:hypothetical protein